MAKMFPNLMKNFNPQIPEAQQTSNSTDAQNHKAIHRPKTLKTKERKSLKRLEWEYVGNIGNI